MASNNDTAEGLDLVEHLLGSRVGNSATSGHDDSHLEVVGEGRECGGSNAVVGRKTRDHDLPHTFVPQEVGDLARRLRGSILGGRGLGRSAGRENAVEG